MDEGTMIDSHALVGSCAQVGKHVHLSAASQLGGVLEPVGALPVIIEDNVFIGGNCGIYEGTIVKENAVIGTGVIINASTAIYDATTGKYIRANENGQIVVPEGAVVVAGSRPISKGPGAEQGIHLYCPVIVKYRDAKTSGSITLEDMLREYVQRKIFKGRRLILPLSCKGNLQESGSQCDIFLRRGLPFGGHFPA